MSNAYVDADGHVIERDRELREFLPAPYRGMEGKRRERARRLRTLNVEL